MDLKDFENTLHYTYNETQQNCGKGRRLKSVKNIEQTSWDPIHLKGVTGYVR